MVQETIISLKNERNTLLTQYIKANSKDKAVLLVKIMDIDEKLDDISGHLKIR